MTVKVTVPNTSSDSVVFGSANTPTAAEVVGIDSGSSNGQLAFKTTASGTSTERMRIDSSGNITIGTTTALAPLGIYNTNNPYMALGNSLYYTYFNQTTTDFHLYTNAAYPVRFGTNNTERMRINSIGYVTNAVNGLGNGLVQASQYYRLNSGLAGANVNTAQSLFGVGVTLVGSTVYEFEILVALAKTAGTTSHTVSTSFGGTATVNNISYYLYLVSSTSTLASVSSIFGAQFVQTAAATVSTGAITSATQNLYGIIKGTVSINAGGTFIPQYTLSAAPGGAYTTQAGSYIKISPLSASGANTSVGSWA